MMELSFVCAFCLVGVCLPCVDPALSLAVSVADAPGDPVEVCAEVRVPKESIQAGRGSLPHGGVCRKRVLVALLLVL